jgi:hypothetical protein
MVPVEALRLDHLDCRSGGLSDRRLVQRSSGMVEPPRITPVEIARKKRSLDQLLSPVTSSTPSELLARLTWSFATGVAV